MTSPTNIRKSRGHNLFDRQAQLHNDTPAELIEHPGISSSTAVPPQKTYHSNSSPPPSTSYNMRPLVSTPSQPSSSQQQHNSPHLIKKSLFTSNNHQNHNSENIISENDSNITLIGVRSRPISTYIESTPIRKSPLLQETDFPLTLPQEKEQEQPYDENSTITTTAPTIATGYSLQTETACAMVEKAFDYLNHDDDDDVVVGTKEGDYQTDEFEDDFDDEDNDSVDSDAVPVKDRTVITDHNSDTTSTVKTGNYKMLPYLVLFALINIYFKN
ncbi:unnamed protein product [Didymodactylos carnosus]|uniref:Uncharacterized protein n=1 Tax=Didymodactylos carnosus TaxID=1234261 RepID=A0A813V8X8_9BILA|nr:unnamed protein product [Didymodactylos carnosus]CAF3621843.1 unnamed protein product [Didymodactylos carnosus]